ncbi:hypothetical protein HPP92_004325 [Vanilla planifolia]|uniref:Uncharacterized protein n=1 Tax=Vanilla planifolia TaxID=51239 RepID=A0A835VED6_VANPL|nr:hypothetical protein HPP92_004325 [Vanilla planifolia]
MATTPDYDEGCLQEWKASNTNFKLPEPVPVMRFLYELCWAMVRGDLPFQKCKLALDSANFVDGKKEEMDSFLADVIAHMGQDVEWKILHLDFKGKKNVNKGVKVGGCFARRGEDSFVVKIEVLSLQERLDRDLKRSSRDLAMADPYKVLRGLG